jgi:NCS1 family nucleobase:cation symporter-1
MAACPRAPLKPPRPRGISTTAFAFSVMAQFNSVMGSNSALIVTVPDLARYARNGRHQMYGQLVDLPLSIICAAFGCITTVSAPLPGKLTSSPLSSTCGARATGIFTTSSTVSLTSSTLPKPGRECSSPRPCGRLLRSAPRWHATSLVSGDRVRAQLHDAECLAFASDVTCMLPKYINIVRGQFLCVIIATATTPW